jgi:hypothetical protein
VDIVRSNMQMIVSCDYDNYACDIAISDEIH